MAIFFQINFRSYTLLCFLISFLPNYVVKENISDAYIYDLHTLEHACQQELIWLSGSNDVRRKLV